MDATLPAVHALHLATLLERWDVPPRELLAGSGLSEDALARPGARLPMPTVIELTERARRLSGEPGLGFYLGLQMRVSTHGELGVAAMTASTVREALELAERFAPTRTTALSLRLHEDAGVAAVAIDEHVSLGSVRDVILLSLVVGLWQMGMALTGRELRGDVDLAFEEPGYFARFAPFAPGRVRFGQPVSQLVFDPSILELPIVMADPVAQRVAREQCEQALDALGEQATFLARVRAHLPREEGGFHRLEEVARRMHVSERTLKRRLREEGTTFSRLVEEQRRHLATLLLRSPDPSVEEIADRLGYADPANFTRAFRRWTGQSPRAFRRSAS
ncbi:MAG: AraC family transcriptional regulator [Myxococcota bacterium]